LVDKDTVDKDILRSLLDMHMNQLQDFRTLQWEGVKYYTSILSLILSLILGSLGFVIANLKGLENMLIFFKITYLIASFFLIYVSYFASLNLHRETTHLFTEIYVIHKIRKKLGLYSSEDIYPKEIISDLDMYKDGINSRSGVLLRIKDKKGEKIVKMDMHSIATIFKATLLSFIKRNTYSTFLGIMTRVFIFFFILGVVLFLFFCYFFRLLYPRLSKILVSY